MQEGLLNLFKEGLFYDRIMQARIAHTAMDDLAEIEPVLQKMEQSTATKRLIPHDTALLCDVTL